MRIELAHMDYYPDVPIPGYDSNSTNSDTSTPPISLNPHIYDSNMP